MAVENGEWIMYGVEWTDPKCLHTLDDLISCVDKEGFLPLFKNEISGFSVEERTAPEYWWCEDERVDPWIWRELAARSGKVAYGKFFDKKAGFISREWLPVFANYRRDGYDFDARWDDELASMRQKKIMDLFDNDTELYSFETKAMAGFGKNGEKNFEGVVTGLQMQMYLCMKDFQRRRNRSGEEYGWNIAVYSKPEHLWGYEYITSRYNELPEDSWKRIVSHMRDHYPAATDRSIRKVLG